LKEYLHVANEKTKEIDLGNDFGAVALKINGIRLEIGADGKAIKITSDTPVAVTAATNTADTKKALEVGEHMKDGTVVIAVDLKKNTALFAPEGIFGGNSDFDEQDGIVKKANEQKLASHKDWRRVTDSEASALAKAWDKVAPRAMQDSYAPWFWGASTDQFNSAGRVYRGGESDPPSITYLAYWRPVPVVRNGAAIRS
jgi:cell wall-associated NlpC family hydrolase